MDMDIVHYVSDTSSYKSLIFPIQDQSYALIYPMKSLENTAAYDGGIVRPQGPSVRGREMEFSSESFRKEVEANCGSVNGARLGVLFYGCF